MEPGFEDPSETARRQRVAFVSVHYYPEYLSRSLRSSLQLARRLNAQEFIAIANRSELLAELEQNVGRAGFQRTATLLHNNVGSEFGAYQAGLERARGTDPDWVVFANDTFSLHALFSRLNRKHLCAALSSERQEPGGRVAGYVDSIPRSFFVQGLRTHRWVRTSIFALDRDALAVLKHRLYRPELEELVRSIADPEQFFSPRVDPCLAQHLRAWLFSAESPYAWYGAEPLGELNVARFARKARSVLQEKCIAAVLEEGQAWFLDIKTYSVRERGLERLEAAFFKPLA
jgi:hypothetical protein